MPIRMPQRRFFTNAPVVAVTFRHVVWIEITQQAKELRLATFKPPNVNVGDASGNPILVEASVITLNAPADALEDTRQIVFDEAAGILVITNEAGQAFTVYFADQIS